MILTKLVHHEPSEYHTRDNQMDNCYRYAVSCIDENKGRR